MNEKIHHNENSLLIEPCILQELDLSSQNLVKGSLN